MSDKPISQEKLDSLFWIVDRPKHAQEKEMDLRLAQYIEHCEAAFIKGWTDCEEGIPAREYQTDPYYTGYSNCYEYENQTQPSDVGEDMG